MFSRNQTSIKKTFLKKTLLLIHYNKPYFPFQSFQQWRTFILSSRSDQYMLHTKTEQPQNTKSKPQIHSPNPYPATSMERNVLAFSAGVESSLNRNVITSNRLLHFCILLKSICIPCSVTRDQQFPYTDCVWQPRHCWVLVLARWNFLTLICNFSPGHSNGLDKRSTKRVSENPRSFLSHTKGILSMVGADYAQTHRDQLCLLPSHCCQFLTAYCRV